jgi:hypothetical protein
MKKHIFGISLLGIMIIASCTPGTGTAGHHITSSSTGSAGSFSSTGSSVTTSGAAGAKISILGMASSGAKMYIILNPYAGVTGTFPLSDTSNTLCQYNPAGGAAANPSVHGTVTLTSVTPNIVGTFSFTGRDSSIFTGSFNAPMP